MRYVYMTDDEYAAMLDGLSLLQALANAKRDGKGLACVGKDGLGVFLDPMNRQEVVAALMVSNEWSDNCLDITHCALVVRYGGIFEKRHCLGCHSNRVEKHEVIGHDYSGVTPSA